MKRFTHVPVCTVSGVDITIRAGYRGSGQVCQDLFSFLFPNSWRMPERDLTIVPESLSVGHCPPTISYKLQIVGWV